MRKTGVILMLVSGMMHLIHQHVFDKTVFMYYSWMHLHVSILIMIVAITGAILLIKEIKCGRATKETGSNAT